MSVTQQKWQSKKCRVEKGVFFGNDEFIEVSGEPKTGYSCGQRAAIASIIEANPDYWCHLGETTTCREKNYDLSIHAGETSWEGEGFLAVTKLSTGELLWVLHLSDSEGFNEVKLDGNIIRAVSGVYPARYEWNVPIDAPEKFVCRAA